MPSFSGAVTSFKEPLLTLPQPSSDILHDTPRAARHGARTKDLPMPTLAALTVSAVSHALLMSLLLAPPQGLLRQQQGAFDASSFAAPVVSSPPDGWVLAESRPRSARPLLRGEYDAAPAIVEVPEVAKMNSHEHRDLRRWNWELLWRSCHQRRPTREGPSPRQAE